MNDWKRWSDYLDEAGLRLYRDKTRVAGPRSTLQAEVKAEPPANSSDAPSWPTQDATSNATETLDDIRRDLGDCRRCKLASGRTNVVFGEGDPHARLMFVGEGPGADEDRQGRPFVGAAGQLLDKMIMAMGLRRQDVYIANIVKSRPPRNRDPEPDEIAACFPFLQRQIRAIAPEVIVTLGKPAARTLLGLDGPISVYRGKWQRYESVAAMPTFHPAYLLRNAAEKRHAWEDLQAVMARLGLPAQTRGG